MMKLNHLNYGAMTIDNKIITNDNINYIVTITDNTLYRESKKENKVIAMLKFNILNPDSLEVLETSKDYPSNMCTDIIRNSLFSIFPNTNINKTSNLLTTSIEKRNTLKLNRVKKDFKGHVSMPNVINL